LKNRMAKFLDVHNLKGVNEETLRKVHDSPKDGFGITHDNLIYNKEEDKPVSICFLTCISS